MRAAILESFAGPAGVRIIDMPAPTPKRGEVLVKVICSPVNPSDVLYCSGLYGSLPKYPSSLALKDVERWWPREAVLWPTD